MGKERILEKTKKARISRFIHVGEIIPGILGDIERRIKDSHKDEKVSLRTEAKEEA